MITSETTSLWVAYGDSGVVGTIRKGDDGYTVTMAGASSSVGTYPTMDAAKGALNSHQRPGSGWPQFREH
ncbi:methyltransferase [Microbacterium sp.]|uniref:methyltransferase n=1 Tax=Microbacterium sp. TaxID=51671 RepID=UPI0039E32EE1